MPAGRPTKYKPEMCQKVIDHFSIPPVTYVEDNEGNIKTDKKGQPIEIVAPLPTIENVAPILGVHVAQVYRWQDKHEEFREAIKEGQAKQKDLLVQNGLMGRYDRTFAIFVSKNFTDMHDKQHTVHDTSDNFNQFLDTLKNG